MLRTRALPLITALIALSLTSCGGGGDGGEKGKGSMMGDAANGKRLFAANGCGGCHTFGAAGAKGTTGPNLDTSGPSREKVISQLEQGGGAMPSFKDKLSDEEMRDLAAFVGKVGGAGSAVVAPFKPDDVRLGDCKDRKPECLEQAFGNVTYNEGPQKALALLESRSASDQAVLGDCHRIAHRMGSAALVRFKGSVAKAFIAGSPVCASGYYHGIVERGFLGKPRHRLGAVASKMCDDPDISGQPFLSYQCIHGLGHGLMIYTGYDMPLSLRTCDALEDEFTQVSCAGGVFMENFNSSYGVRSRYVRDSDPIYPCNAVADRHKAQCYGLVTANLLRVTNYDLARTAAGCRRSEREWIVTCFQSFGRDVSGIARKSARAALDGCRHSGRYERDCVYGVSSEITNADAGGERAARFCRRAPAATRQRCYSGIGAVLASLIPGRADLARACGRLSGSRYSADCRVAAGVG